MNKYYLSLFLVLQYISLSQISTSLSQKDYIKTLNNVFIHYKYIARADWINYGPLKINIFSLRIKNNSQIYQAYNAESKPIYIAINCINKNINVTNQRLEWKGWQPPLRGFEFNILNDLCKFK